MNRSYNPRAIIKFATFVILAMIIWKLNFPIFHLWTEWLQDIYRFNTDPVFTASYSLTKKLFYAVYPILFVTFIGLWYIFLFKQHRKNYYSNGFVQGTVMWIFNKPGKARGHVYDFFSILHGFREIEWKEIPRPLTGNAFDEKMIIYWRSSFWQPMTHWNKDYIVHPDKNFRESFNTVFAGAKYRVNFHHPYNPKCDFNILTDRELYAKELRALETAKIKDMELNYQITEDVQRMARANPDVANDMAHKDIPIPKKTRDKLKRLKDKDVSS